MWTWCSYQIILLKCDFSTTERRTYWWLWFPSPWLMEASLGGKTNFLSILESQWFGSKDPEVESNMQSFKLVASFLKSHWFQTLAACFSNTWGLEFFGFQENLLSKPRSVHQIGRWRHCYFCLPSVFYLHWVDICLLLPRNSVTPQGDVQEMLSCPHQLRTEQLGTERPVRALWLYCGACRAVAWGFSPSTWV